LSFIVNDFGDVLSLIGIASAIGAVAGVVTSLTRPPAGRSTAVFGIDNRLRYPCRYKNKSGTRIWGIDLGSIGPALIGAGGAVFVVFATGVDKSEVEIAGATEIRDAINYIQLVVLAIAGGAAGELVFRTLAAGDKVSLASAEKAVRDTAQEAREAAAEGVDPKEVQRRAERAGDKAIDDERKRDEDR